MRSAPTAAGHGSCRGRCRPRGRSSRRPGRRPGSAGRARGAGWCCRSSPRQRHRRVELGRRATGATCGCPGSWPTPAIRRSAFCTLTFHCCSCVGLDLERRVDVDAERRERRRRPVVVQRRERVAAGIAQVGIGEAAGRVGDGDLRAPRRVVGEARVEEQVRRVVEDAPRRRGRSSTVALPASRSRRRAARSCASLPCGRRRRPGSRRHRGRSAPAGACG